MSTYNGWSNRVTWLISLWFNPETSADVEMIREQVEHDYENLPAYMRDFIDISAIDWIEILENLEGEQNDE